jgi:hypothetical protein
MLSCTVLNPKSPYMRVVDSVEVCIREDIDISDPLVKIKSVGIRFRVNGVPFRATGNGATLEAAVADVVAIAVEFFAERCTSIAGDKG